MRRATDLDGRYCINGTSLDAARVVDFDIVGAKGKQLLIPCGKHDLPRGSLADSSDNDNVKQVAEL